MKNNTQTRPVLYSFRRCPYAMRARLALAQAGVTVTLREVVLRDKPAAMLELSPKGTVPVLQIDEPACHTGRVIDESLDIMYWALAQNDPAGWWHCGLNAAQQAQTQALIEENDGTFKADLDRYKYHSRHPEHPPETYRAQGERFFTTLEQHLRDNEQGLVCNATTLADVAIFPFIRQFANVDSAWFANAPYPRLRGWLEAHLESSLFRCIMTKRPAWQPGDAPTIERWDKPA